MARGGYGAGDGVPLAARRRPDAEPARTAPARTSPPDHGVRPGQHCWISLPVDGSVPAAGLLVEWRRLERGRWEGRVVYVAELRTQHRGVVDEWVPAEYLVPRS